MRDALFTSERIQAMSELWDSAFPASELPQTKRWARLKQLTTAQEALVRTMIHQDCNYATDDDVIDALLRVASHSLGMVEHMLDNNGNAMNTLSRYVERQHRALQKVAKNAQRGKEKA